MHARQDLGLGLISMRERLRLVNGTFSITSEPGVSTIVTAIIPFFEQNVTEFENAKQKAIALAE